MRTLSLLALASLFFLPACGAESAGGSGDGPTYAFVTNCVDPFWTLAKAGVLDAEAELGVNCVVVMPESDGGADQQRRMEELLARGVAGIAISPANAENQVDMLNEAAAQTILITHDSDAPLSERRYFIGVDNYSAGRACGKLVREALPEGGDVMLFIGNMDQDNSKLRRQGVIDELLERSFDRERFDPLGEIVAGNGFRVLDTRTDGTDVAVAQANAEDALVAHPELAAMVGLFNSNPPACLQALEGAGRLGEVVIAGFDENEVTLQGIADGHIVGTVSQDPYQYGYQAVHLLHKLAQGEGELPEDVWMPTELAVVTSDNVDAFRTELARQLEAGQ